ncbi:MAG: hypothetical protein ABR543_04470 [Gemmatimonadaceae bacterium]
MPRRSMFLGAAGMVAFLVALVGLIFVPSRARRRAAQLMPAESQYSDTSRPLQAIRHARVLLEATELALDSARKRAANTLAPEPAYDTLPTELRAKRAELAAQALEIQRLQRRSREAPLPESYRALGNARALREEPRVRQLLDSLADVERNREAFGALGGVDPIFVALTERAGEIGRSLQVIGAAKEDSLRAELNMLAPRRALIAPPPSSATSSAGSAIDTLRHARAREVATVEIANRERDLALVRTRNRALDERAAAARRMLSLSASPMAMLAAALVLGLAIGFAVTLLREIRSPRIADGAEAEAIAAAPVLVTVLPWETPPERNRREADRQVPALIERGSEVYQRLFSRLAAEPPGVGLIAVVGDDMAVTAVVAANIAATAAYHARTSLLVDTDFDSHSASAATHVQPAPGIAEFLARRTPWAESLRPVVVGRDRLIEVLPAGLFNGRGTLHGAMNEFKREIALLTRRFDTVILSAPPSRHGAVPAVGSAAGSVLLCVRATRTPVSWIRGLVVELREHDARVRGIVLWDRPDPVLLLPSAPAETRVTG